MIIESNRAEFQPLSFIDGVRLSTGLMRRGQDSLIEELSGQTESVYFRWPHHIDKLLRVSEGIAVIIDPLDAKELLESNHEVLVKDSRDIRIIREFLGGSLVPNYGGEEWWDRRKLLAPSFSHAKVAEFGDTITRFTQDKIARWKKDGLRHIPMKNELTELTIQVITDYMFHAHLSEATIAEIRDHVTVITSWASKRIQNMGLPPRGIPSADNRRFTSSLNSMQSILEKIYDSRQTSGDQHVDMFSVLCNAQYDEKTPILKNDVIDESLSMLIAGHETTANMLSWTIYELSQHPEIQQEMYQELNQVVGDRRVTVNDFKQLPFLTMVLKESIRLHPPVWMFTRKNIEQIRISGNRVIPEKTFIVFSPLLMHRNTKYWVTPHEFYPKRFDTSSPELGAKVAYMPFGYSQRSCLGQDLAMTEAKLVLANIIQEGFVSTEKTIKAEMLITNRPSTPVHTTLHLHNINT